MKTCLADGHQGSQCNHVAAREDRSRARNQTQQNKAPGVSALLVETGLLGVLRRQVKLRLLHRALKASKTVHRIGKVQRTRDSCQLGMSQLNQMTSGVVSS